MNFQLVWLAEAKSDLQRLHEFIAIHNPQAAKRAVLKIIDAAETLITFPERGKPWDQDINYRELIVRFGARGYVIRYRLFADDIVIVRVWHGLEERN